MFIAAIVLQSPFRFCCLTIKENMVMSITLDFLYIVYKMPFKGERTHEHIRTYV